MSEPNPADYATNKRPLPRPDDTGAPDSTGPRARTTFGGGAPRRIGRFQVRGLLGEGAFARVYLGFDEELGREVAIKVPKADELTPEFRESFVRENRLAAIIHHPNICPIFEVGADGNVPYIVMRVIPTTLAGLLKRLGGPLPPRNAVAVTRKLALGLTAAHAQNVVHRDLKPANVLYDEANREVLIADFGLARFADQASAASDGVPKGTPAYMAPEQARGRAAEVGPLSDIYALGVILYELLTGRAPFAGSVWEVMRDHCETPPEPPSHRAPGIDPALDELCLKAMAKRPADRYPSAKAFAAALADYLRADERGGERPASVSGAALFPVLPPSAPRRAEAAAPAFEVVEEPELAEEVPEPVAPASRSRSVKTPAPEPVAPEPPASASRKSRPRDEPRREPAPVDLRYYARLGVEVAVGVSILLAGVVVCYLLVTRTRVSPTKRVASAPLRTAAPQIARPSV